MKDGKDGDVVVPVGSPIALGIKYLVIRSHRLAVEKGWHVTNAAGVTVASGVPVAEKLALIHSEISEALEEYRSHGEFGNRLDDGKPEGFVIELADAVIRIADLCGALGLNLASAVERKHKYNETRTYRHGNKKC